MLLRSVISLLFLSSICCTLANEIRLPPDDLPDELRAMRPSFTFKFPVKGETKGKRGSTSSLAPQIPWPPFGINPECGHPEIVTEDFSHEALGVLINGLPCFPDDVHVPYMPTPLGACVHRDNLTAAFPDIAENFGGDIIPEVCKQYITYDLLYVDPWLEYRASYAAGVITSSSLIADEDGCFNPWNRAVCVDFWRPCEWVDVPEENQNMSTRFYNSFEGEDIPFADFFPFFDPIQTRLPVGRYVCREMCLDRQVACQGVAETVYSGLTGWTPTEILECEPFEGVVNTPNPWLVGRPYAGYNRPWAGHNYFYSPGGGEGSSLDVYPDGNYTLNISADGGQTYFTKEVECFDDNRLIVGEFITLCPEPLIKQGERLGSFCQFECPEPVLDDEEYDQVQLMMSIVGWFSFISSMFLLVTYIIDPSKRRFPAVLPIFFFWCVMWVAFVFVLGSVIGHEDVWCDDEGRNNDWGDPACTVQGIFYVYFSMASTCWWLVIAFNMLLLGFQGSASAKTMCSVWKDWTYNDLAHLLYHLFAWGLPLIVLIIGLSAERIGYNGSNFWCTVIDGDNLEFSSNAEDGTTHDGGGDLWNLLLISVPILVMVLIGSVLLMIVIVYSAVYSRAGWKYFINEWRLFAFLFLYIYIYVFVISAQIHYATERDAVYDSYDDYINCVFVAQSSMIEGCLFLLDNDVSYPLLFIAAFNVAAQGFFVFLIFGTSMTVPYAWYNLIVKRRFTADSNLSDTSATKTSLKSIRGTKKGATIESDSD